MTFDHGYNLVEVFSGEGRVSQKWQFTCIIVIDVSSCVGSLSLSLSMSIPFTLFIPA